MYHEKTRVVEAVGSRNHVERTICRTRAAKPHTRIERGVGDTARADAAPLTTNESRFFGARLLPF